MSSSSSSSSSTSSSVSSSAARTLAPVPSQLDLWEFLRSTPSTSPSSAPSSASASSSFSSSSSLPSSTSPNFPLSHLSNSNPYLLSSSPSSSSYYSPSPSSLSPFSTSPLALCYSASSSSSYHHHQAMDHTLSSPSSPPIAAASQTTNNTITITSSPPDTPTNGSPAIHKKRTPTGSFLGTSDSSRGGTGGSLRSLLSGLSGSKVKKKDKERGKIIDFGEQTPIPITSSLSPPGGGGGGIGIGSSGGFGSSSLSSSFSGGSSPTVSGPSPISKHMALARTSSKKGKHWFSLNRRPSGGNTGKSEAPFHRFPQGCSSFHYSSHLLPHEHVLGTKQPASFATYFFENFTPDPSNSVLDGQLLCTNYRILFVPSPESKTRSPKRKGDSAENSIISIPYRALTSVRLVDRFSGNPFTTFTSDYELLMEEIPSFLEEEDNLNVLVDSISLRELTAPASLPGSGGLRKCPKLVVLTSMDFRRETFFVKSEGIARIIGKICQKLTDPRSASQLVASCGRSYPSPTLMVSSPSSPMLTSSPAQNLKRTLFEQLNSSQGEGSWVRYPTSEVCNTNNNLYSAEVIFPSKVMKEIVSGVAQTFYRQSFPQPSSYNPKNGTVLWRVSNLVNSDVGLEKLLDFFVAAQTGGLPFFILVAGNRVDYATYSKTKLPESCCVGCEYLSTPTFTNIIQAFFELSDQCMQGPFPSNIGEITILNSDDEMTGISVSAAPPRSSSNLYDTSPSSALKNWLNVFQNSQWQGCVTKIMNATKEVVVKMDEKRHIFLASAVSNMISILVELVRDPESRTISGFLKLLEREWFQGSYRSSDLASTLSLSNLTDETELSAILAFSCSTDETPVLLTLLFDCIFQLMAINPSRFEFSQDLLLFLLDEHYLCRFDSSITLPHSDRNRLKSCGSQLASLWDFVSLNLTSNNLISSRYESSDLNLMKPLETPSEVIPWTNAYLRFPLRSHMNAFSTKLEAIPTDFKALDFTDKGLAWFPPSVLYWWTNIQVLDLSNNSLYFLPQEIPFLRHLAVLRLSKNNLLQIDRKDLGALGCLQELDFTGNRLRKVKGLRKLRLTKLKIGGNRLKRLPHLPPTVQRLEAGGNPYSSCNIAKLQHAALYSLDLSRSSLSEIPSKLERATNLETLILAGNQLTTIPTSFSSLAKIVTLVLSENPLGCIPPIVFSLANLKDLALEECQISVIDDDIEKLSSLEKLQLSKNRISTLPPALFSLSSLSFLDLSDNDISDLPKKIENLENLQELLLSKNQIYSLPSDLLALSKLTNLDVRFCRVEHIPPEVGMMTSLKSLKIAGNNLKTPPAEIASKGLAATMSFLRSLCGSDLQLSYQIKVSVVGPPSSGKTSVVAKLNNPLDSFSKLPSTSSSVFDSTVLGLLRQTPTNLKMCEVPTVLSVNATRATKKQVTFNVWEFEGAQEYTHISHKFFLSDGSLYLVVINLAEPLEAANLDYWLNSIKKGAPNSPIIVVGTHQEKVTKAVSGNFAESVMSQFGSLVKAVVTVSSMKDLGFDRLSEAIEVAVQDHCLVGELVSARFSTLEKLVKSESNAPLITWVEFEGLCKRVSIPPSEAESALYVLQRNGSGPFRLTEPPELAGWVCTNPSWLVDMVAKLSSSKDLCPNGILAHSLLGQIWSPMIDQCEEAFHPFLMRLLLHFQLGFCLTPEIQEVPLQKSFFPMLLQRERPSELEKEWPVFSEAEWCRREYSFNSLPEGFFARCQVGLLAHRPSWTPLLAWTNGILIKTDVETILFEQLPTAKKIQFTIRQQVSGTVFALVDGDIRNLAKTYNLNIKVTMPCVHCYRKKVYDVNEFTLRECEMALESGLSVVYCHGLVPVRLDKVAPDIALAAVSDLKVEYNQIEILNFIDEGGYGTVYRGTYRDMEVAVKILKTSDQKDVKMKEERDDGAINSLSSETTSSGTDSETEMGSPRSPGSPGVTRKEKKSNELKEKKKEKHGQHTSVTSMEELRREIWIMSGLSHPNIVAMIGYCISPPCIVSEFIPEGNLLKLILDEKQPLGMGLILRIAVDISRALEFLHVQLNPPMIHNDLKSPNVLLSSIDENAPIVAKLADFGTSKRAAWGSLSDPSSINPRWLAPEILQGSAFTSKVDIYSFGVILWEMISRKMYMSDARWMFTIRDRITSGFRPEIPPTLPELSQLISACWATKPEDRPDITQCHLTLSATIKSKFPEILEFVSLSTPAVPGIEQGVTDCDDQLHLSTKVLSPRQFTDTAGSVKCMRGLKWKQVWCGDGAGNITVFTEDGVRKQVVHCHEKEIFDIIATKEYVFTISLDDTMKVWTKKVDLVKILPVGQATAIGKILGKIWIAGETEILVYDKRTLKNERKIKLSTTDTGGGLVTCMLWQKPYVWLGTSFNILRMNVQTGRVVDVLRGHNRIIHRLIPVGKEIWSCSSDRSIRVWDRKTGQCLHILNAHSGRVFNLQVEVGPSPIVWSCAWDSTIMIWDGKTKQLLYECAQFHKDAVSSLVQVGGYMWSGSWDQRICLWETIGMKTLWEALATRERDHLLHDMDLYSLLASSGSLSLSGGGGNSSFSSLSSSSSSTTSSPRTFSLSSSLASSVSSISGSPNVIPVSSLPSPVPVLLTSIVTSSLEDEEKKIGKKPSPTPKKRSIRQQLSPRKE